MVLWINSTFPDHVEVALTIGVEQTPIWKSIVGRDVLAAAMGVLKRKKKNITHLTSIVVVPGPGPFSRVRAGVTVANTLAFALSVPLWTLRAGKLRRVRGVLAPHYGKPPNITKPRRTV